MSPSKILFFLCLSFVAGIALQSFVKIPQIFDWGFLFADFLAIIIFIFIKKDILLIFGFCFLLLIIGVLRMQISEFNIANDKLAKLNGKGTVVLTGVINDEPDVRDTSQKLKVKVGNSTILVTANRYPEYQYLDKLKITGKLMTPAVYDDFNYKDYLLKDGIYSVMSFAKFSKQGKAKPDLWQSAYSKILWFKGKLRDSIDDNFLPPHSLLLQGIILGDNKNMTQDLRDKLNTTGLRFLTAISGVHVVILSLILFSLLMFFGLGKNYALGLSVIFIWLYVVITGFTPSGIRAATMGSVFILAEVFGRQNTSSRTIVLAGALMLLQNPLLLIYDIGFQLSFMACLGIIYLKPLIAGLLKFLFKEHPSTGSGQALRELLDIISVTLTAQIFTLPLMVFNFGSISLIAPLTNILILPVMPLILSFGFLFAIFAAISKFLGWIFYIPIWVLITYFLKVMDFFSQPWMSKTITSVSWVWLAVFYLILGTLIIFLNKKYSKKFL